MGKSFEGIISDRYNDESFELDEELKYGNPPEYFVKSEATKIRKGYYQKLGPLIGITETNELGKLRIKITKDPSKKIPPLSSIQGNLQTVNFLRDYYGFNPISQEEYDAITTTSQEVAGEESEAQEPQIEDTEVSPNVEVIQERTEEDRTPTVEGELSEEQPDDDHDSQGEEKTLGVTSEQETRQSEIIFSNKEINNLTFNLSRYTGDDDQRFAIIEDDLEELGLSEEEIKNYISQKGIPEIPSTSIQIGDEYFDWWDRHISGYSYKELALSEYYGIHLNHNPVEVEQLDASAAEDAPSSEVSTNDTALRDALAEAVRLVEEESKQSENTEQSSVNPERIIEQAELLNQAREAIRLYQEFGQQHPYHTRDQATQEQYRQLEKLAWEALNKIAHSQGGDIIALPQQREIELSHPEPIDTRQYLETMGYQFDSEGNIIMIADKGKSIVLNRSYPIDAIVNSPRPAHVVYDRDINLDEAKTLPYYHGHLVRGLNPNTPEFIKGVLDKDFLESNIVEGNLVSETASTLNAQELESIPVATESDITSNEEKVAPEDKIETLRVAYARAEELYNRNHRNKDAKEELDRIREEYNQEVENILTIKVAEGLESEIQDIFTKEVQALRESRITQSKELQSGFERAINPIKEKLLNFAIKHKKPWAFTNISLTTAGILLASTGAGIPVAGALKVFQRAVGSAMTGAAAREGMRALLEDADVKVGKLKWQSVIPKLVAESLQDGYVDAATDTDLSTKLSTLEAYYRLNGGKFTNDSQQKAYEIILMKLGQRVQEKTIENNQSREKNDSKLMQGEENKETSPATGPEIEKAVSTPEQNNARYTSELLKTMSEKRISELQKQQKKRLVANIVGTAVGGRLMTSLAVDMMRPGGVLSPEQVSATSKPEVEPISPNPEEVGGTSETAKAMAQNLSPEQLQDISELSSGETLWSEMAIKLGENATDAQIQQAVEAYMGTSQGQETMFSLASQTEGGRALLSQWGIDNAAELSQVSKSDLFKLSRHLGVGELKGLDTLDLSNLPPLEDISTPTEFNPAESTDSGITPPGPGAESVPQVDKNIFMSEAAKTLGIDNANLTETEFTNIMYSYLETEQGRDALYNLALSDESGQTLLEQFGVYSIEDFNRLSPTELYNLSQSVDLNNLEGFNLNDIILSKFENAPDSISLVKGAGPLTQVNQYIDLYAGGLPYDSTLGQEVLNTYINTPAGKNWLYEAIVSNPNPNDQNVQLFREYLSYKGIKSAADFSERFNWADFSSDNRIPTSGFWRPVKLPNTTTIMQPLSTFLQPSKMTGIKEVVNQVLTR